MSSSFNIENGVLIEYIGEDTIVNIPEGVVEIGENAFCRKPIEEVFIPSTVTIIGKSSFMECEKLRKVTSSSKGIKIIGKAAFCGCEKLNSLEMAMDNEVEIEDAAFSRCKALADNNGFVIIKDILYDYFGNGGDVVIPDGITVINQFCFLKCDPHQRDSVELESVKLPKSLKKIGAFAFQNCWSLTDIIIPDGVTEIEKHAFEKCKYLEEIVLSKQLVKIGDYAFSTCRIRELELPQSLTFIGEGAFMNNEMQKLNLPENIEVISKKAFAGQMYGYFTLHVKKECKTEKIAKSYAKKDKINIEVDT